MNNGPGANAATVTAAAGSRVRLTLAWRMPAMALAGACLSVGLTAALVLTGALPLATDRLADNHGQLMAFGFLGTLIALERAVALRTRWAVLSPLLIGAGGLMQLVAVPLWVGRSMQALGALILLGVYRSIWRRAPSAALAVQTLGAVLMVATAALLAAAVAMPAVVPLLAGFLILTIAGERLELARVAAPGPRAETALLVLAALITCASLIALLWPAGGTEIFGACVLGVAVWLARYDVAARMWRATGLPRYAAYNLLAGIFWLGVAGSTWLLAGPQPDGPGYDLVVHAIGLGFAMSMVMAHAPVILPAVVLRPLPYRPVLYCAAVGLQVTLALRVIGDLRSLGWAWSAGTAGNVAAVVAFLAISATLAVRR